MGARPIDQHIKGFELLGAEVNITGGNVCATADKLIGTNIYMDIVSVGATINIMLASVLAEGTTTIDNAAKEPHIVDIANFLNTMGADIRGASYGLSKPNLVHLICLNIHLRIYHSYSQLSILSFFQILASTNPFLKEHYFQMLFL